MLKAIIFDFDGVIADSNHACIVGMQKILQHYGAKADYNEIAPLLGGTRDEILGKFLSGADLKMACEKGDEISGSADFRDSIKIVDGGVEALSDMSSKYKLAIFSGAESDVLKYLLKKFGINMLFEVVVGADDVVRHKPHPEGLLKAIKALGVDKKDCLFVGDAPYDVLAGKSAGVKVCIVRTGVLGENGLDEMDVDEMGIDFVAEDIVELSERV